METQTNESGITEPIGMENSWVQPIAKYIQRTLPSTESRMRTSLSCDSTFGKKSLFVPPDMAELQPRSLAYLRKFAVANGLQLVEDRRQIDIQPIVEKRNEKPPLIAAALSMLLKQTGIPGSPKPLSKPHRLNADSPLVSIRDLISMAAYSSAKAKRVRIFPNPMLVDVLEKDTHPITGFACKLISSEATIILSHFDSPNFRAIGYSTGQQYVIHVCLGGGPLHEPSLWTSPHTLTHTNFKFQLFPAENSRHDFGLAYATFYLDLADEKPPWWISEESDTHATDLNSSLSEAIDHHRSANF